jgi:hypothetical protein
MKGAPTSATVPSDDSATDQPQKPAPLLLLLGGESVNGVLLQPERELVPLLV